MFDENQYERLLADIFCRFPSVQNVGFKGAYKPGLEHIEAFADLLGNPHRDYAVIHVAGTNGKGSVANMLASALASCGYRTALYTSPHIVDFRERMRLAVPNAEGLPLRAEMVPKEYAHEFLLRHAEDFDRLKLSFFEITTGMAFKWFSDAGAQVAVIETGLGGRLDSTNIVEPLVSIVTSIGLDHCELLGDTLAKIASEKAGIFKAGVPAVCGESHPETRPVFESAANALGCPLHFADELPADGKILANMDLQGKYQEKNLRTVLKAIELLAPRLELLRDGEKAIWGICNAARVMDFHGRWERLSDNPLTICDIGHNAHALRNNFAQLRDMLRSGEASSLTIIYGVMADKNLGDILPLMPREAHYIFVTPSTPRALAAERIYEAFMEGGGDAEVIPEIAQAIAHARSRAALEGGKPIIYIGGSTFVVSDAVRTLV